MLDGSYVQQTRTDQTDLDLAVIPTIPDDNQTPESIISAHARRVINFDEDVEISMRRVDIWRKAKSFYKLAMHNPDCLRKNLLLYYRIPRAEWGNQRDFEMAGIIVAHSILQGGPGLGCLPPVLYALVISGSSDCLLDEFPVLNNVPRSAATFDLIELCEKV